MEKVSVKKSISAVWGRVCQVFKWFIGLFGYKREGKFAKCIWGLFAISSTVVMTYIAVALVVCLYQKLTNKYHDKFCDGEYCQWVYRLSDDVILHNHNFGEIWIMNIRTGKKTLTDVEWVSAPIDENDSLYVYSDGHKRGYFNANTGEVIIPAKYDHAWVFSEGIASVEENGKIKFIDTEGKLAFDRTFKYNPNHRGHVFHGGYCIIDENQDKKYGLMNTKGETVLPEEYDGVSVNRDINYWTLSKNGYSEVIDQNLEVVLPMMEGKIDVWNDCIEVNMPDHTIRKYNLQGQLLEDFCILGYESLYYETEEPNTTPAEEYEVDVDSHDCTCQPEYKTAKARLSKYTVNDDYEGLITQDGHIVTLPLYDAIQAIGPDLYLCNICHGSSIILNGKGQRVK